MVNLPPPRVLLPERTRNKKGKLSKDEKYRRDLLRKRRTYSTYFEKSLPKIDFALKRIKGRREIETKEKYRKGVGFVGFSVTTPAMLVPASKDNKKIQKYWCRVAEARRVGAKKRFNEIKAKKIRKALERAEAAEAKEKEKARALREERLSGCRFRPIAFVKSTSGSPRKLKRGKKKNEG